MRPGLTILFLIAGVSGATAQSAPSEWDQKQACMGDAVSLCAWSIPDHDKIIACMASKHDQLSARCRVVFDASMKARTAGAPQKP